MSQNDIFGVAFAEYLLGKTKEVFNVHIDIGEPDELPVSYFFRNYGQMPVWEQMVLNACGSNVLDAGAGAGSHSLFLQSKGAKVHAIDLSPGAVNCMKKRGVESTQCIDFFELDKGQYDTILFLMNGAGIAGKMEKLPSLFEKASSLLQPGGQIFVESTDILYMFEEEDGSVMIDLADAYYGEIEYRIDYLHYQGEPFPWLFVDYDNLEECAMKVGLNCDPFYRGETNNFVARLFK